MIHELLNEYKLESMLSDGDNFRPFPLYGERDKWQALPDDTKEHFIKSAQNLKNKVYPVLPATVYMNFTRTGDRKSYEDLFFARRYDLLTLTMAECIEGKKEYIDDIINLVWAICEETSWVPCAHNNKGELPDIEYEIFIDLFASETASAMSWTYYFLSDIIAEVSPTVKRRMEIEIQKRILTPYLEYSHFWYMGLKGNVPVNNWNPWINSNVFVAFAIFEKDRERLIKGIEKTAKSIDSFINSYKEDGACDEGPGYFGAAGAALFDYLEELFDITGGKVSVYGNELIKNMARYIYRVYIGGNYYVNFADGSCRPGAPAKLLARTGGAMGDKNLTGFANYILSGNSQIRGRFSVRWHTYRAIKSLFQEQNADTQFVAPKVHWFKDTEILTARDNEGATQGMFIAAKGGHNSESHNHNDVGSFIVYIDEKPVIIDVGVETYTKKTFSSERYTIWTMQSCYHSLPTINGYDQSNGKEYKSSDTEFSHDGNTTVLSMQLKNAYPEEANIKSYVRKMTFEHGKSFMVCDEYSLSQSQKPFVSNMVCFVKPVVKDETTVQLGESAEMTLSIKNGTAEIFIDEIKLTDTRIRNDWQQDCLYRIRISEKDVQEKNNITICINMKKQV